MAAVLMGGRQLVAEPEREGVAGYSLLSDKM